MVSVDVELALVGLVAMLEPATLISSALALAVGERPLRTGTWFFLGGLGLTLAIGVLAAFVLGDAAAVPSSSGPRTGVVIFDVVAGLLLGAYVIRAARRPPDPQKTAANVARIQKLALAPAVTIIAAGALLANAGPFMLVALKDISQLDPSRLRFILDWALFALVSLLPLAIGLLLLLVAPSWTAPRLACARHWVERHAHTIAIVVMGALSVALLRDGIAGIAGQS